MVDDLKAYAEEKYTDSEFETRRKQYDYCPPFTKESLLYREIFEQCYPGQARMIRDFWMPNRSWEAATWTIPPPGSSPTTVRAECEKALRIPF